MPKRFNAKRLPYCEIVVQLAVLLVDAGDAADREARERLVEKRWPVLVRELRRRERGRLWVDCECAVCLLAKQEFTD